MIITQCGKCVRTTTIIPEVDLITGKMKLDILCTWCKEKEKIDKRDKKIDSIIKKKWWKF